MKVTAVSYLNTKPFLYGMVNTGFDQEIDLQLDIPSVCAQKLKDGEVDLGLVPVAVIPELETPYVISDYCIGTVGQVKTVCIYSDCPIESITHLYLDYHSRTSVELAQLLLKKHWKHEPHYLKATEGFIDEIGGTKAAVVIGDRCIGLDQKHPYVYDLGTAWMEYSGLPFVFAAWVSNRPLDPQFIANLNKALEVGLAHIPQLIYLLPTPDPSFDLHTYFTKSISYNLDRDKKKALALFLESISSQLQPSLQASLSMT